jgi:hypothetical protein
LFFFLFIQLLSSTWRTYATTTAPLKRPGPLAEEPVAAQEKCIGTHSENSKLQNEEEEVEKLMVGEKQRCKKGKKQLISPEAHRKKERESEKERGSVKGKERNRKREREERRRGRGKEREK